MKFHNQTIKIVKIKAIKSGGGTGSIIGRNGFQRKKKDALKMFEKITEIYRVKFD